MSISTNINQDNDANHNEYPIFLTGKDGESETSKACEVMANHLAYIIKEISKLRLNQNQTNSIYRLFEDSILHVKLFNCRLMEDENGITSGEVLDVTTNFICSKLSEHRTNYRRKKKFAQNELYVEPHEMAIGLRWDLVRDHQMLTSNLRLVQCKFQYVSMIETINSLFMRDDFSKAYESYNKQSIPGVYNDFSSGNVFRSNELFREFPNSLQIQIATDDFEVCNELGSKFCTKSLHSILLSEMCHRNTDQN